MSDDIEVIIISSDEETVNDDAKKQVDTIDLTTSPDFCLSDFRLNTSKLKALKSRKKRTRLRSTTNSHNRVNEDRCSETYSIKPKESRQSPVRPVKSSPSKSLKIDPAKFKQLSAIVKIELQKSPRSVVKKEKSDEKMEILGNEGVASPPKKMKRTGYSSPCKTPSTQKNLLQYIKSSPKQNILEDVFGKMSLSPSKTPSPKTTPQKNQATLKQWVTPTKIKQNQPPFTPSCNVSAKRNELVWPPQHVMLNKDEFIKRLYKNPREFPTTYEYVLESLQDEDFFVSVVKTICSFMSSDFSPSTEIIWYLIENILSSNASSMPINLTYTLLQDILERYPTKCVGLKITWNHVKTYLMAEQPEDVKKSQVTCCKRSVQSFLLSVLAVEVKTRALKSKQTQLTKHFSLDFDFRHANEVIQCLKKSLANPSAPNSCSGIGKDSQDLPEEISISELELFQNILKLFMIVSLNKENAAIRLADELMYLYIELPNLEQRVLLLQSVMSHQVRQHLIKVLLMNYCSLLPEALEGHDLPLSMQKILLQDFYRVPPNRIDGCDHTAEDVEEYVTLLAYLMQSYVHTYTSLQAYHNDHSLCHQEHKKTFSQEDVQYLEDLEDHVTRLRKRCNGFLKEDTKITLRTNILLCMMSRIV